MHLQFIGILLLFLTPALTACRDSEVSPERQDEEQAQEIIVDDPTGLWTTTPQADGLVLGRTMPGASVYEVVNALNEVDIHNPLGPANPPVLVLMKLEGHTAYVQIINADTLTQRMGSTGAQCFMATATYSLTSVPGIDTVEFDFPEGDHAAPGRYDRGGFPYFEVVEDTQSY